VRLLALIEYGAVAIGIVAMIAGQFFALGKSVQLGVFLAGAGFAFAGLSGVFTRRMPFRTSNDGFESYAGLPALIVGLMALAVGAGAIVSAYLLDMGRWNATVGYLAHRPAPLLAVGGLFLIGTGVLMVLNPQGQHSWMWRILVYVPRATVGILALAAGIAGIALGGWEWVEPKAFDAFVAKLPETLKLLY
jgi:hypothetical protein